MKKTVLLAILLCIPLLALVLISNENEKVCLIENAEEELCIEIKHDLGTIQITPWYDEQTDEWYVFFPSYVKSKKIYVEKLNETIVVNGKVITNCFAWEAKSTYKIEYEGYSKTILFCEDANLSTLFIETENLDAEALYTSIDNADSGKLLSIDSNGNIEYNGKVKELSFHGNGEWNYAEKCSYDLLLNKKGKLGGLEGNRKWKLLSLFKDGDKIHSKLALDIAKILGSEYTSDSEWVNVYINGEYRGIYLLATAIKGQEVFDLPDSYLLEKEIEGRYENENFFITNSGNAFVIKRPKELKKEQKSDIVSTIQLLEKMIESGSLDKSVIDLESFAVQFFVDEFSVNFDAFKTSAYMYKIAGDSTIHAGPAWDYDGAFGEYIGAGEEWVNPETTVLDLGESQLTWYRNLYENEEFQKTLNKVLQEKQEEMKDIIGTGIDGYAEYIEKSVGNDYIRWKERYESSYNTGTYQTWENNVRYLKYFCSKRYNALMERYGVETSEIKWNVTDERHVVTFMAGSDEIFSVIVEDSELLDVEQYAELSYGMNTRWKYSTGVGYNNQYIPVLEDCTLELDIDPCTSFAEGKKIITVMKDALGEDAQYISVFDIDSNQNIETLKMLESVSDEIVIQKNMYEDGKIAIYVFSDKQGENLLREVMVLY